MKLPITLTLFFLYSSFIFSQRCVMGDCYNGFGELINDSSGDKYIGEWKNGKMDGYGAYSGASWTHIGDFLNGMIHGKGKTVYDDGTIYEG